MQRFLLYIKYDGTAYHGWQVQPNGITVQQVLCKVSGEIFGSPLAVTGCSRTDSGVHANEFCCHFDAETSMNCNNIVRAFNSHLPKDIAVFDCKEVDSDFHARYSAKGKNYIYKIYNSPIRDPFYEGYALRVSRSLDAEVLNRAAAEFVGKYDFSAFCAAGCTVEDRVRTVSECSVEKHGNMVVLSISADGFLYNMVRIIAGTLLDVASGKISAEDIKDIISSKDRGRAGQTVPAQGLYLNKVFY